VPTKGHIKIHYFMASTFVQIGLLCTCTFEQLKLLCFIVFLVLNAEIAIWQYATKTNQSFLQLPTRFTSDNLLPLNKQF